MFSNAEQTVKKIKVYSFGTNLGTGAMRDEKKRIKAVAQKMQSMDGLVGATLCLPRGTILSFKSENDAKIARNRLMAIGVACGMNIVESEMDEADLPSKYRK